MNDDERTRRVSRSDEPEAGETSTTRPLGSPPPIPPADDDGETRIWGAPPSEQKQPQEVDVEEEENTKVYIPEGARSESEPNRAERRQPSPDNGPVVGWIVIIDGPGKGNALNLTYGMNQLGRGQGQRLSLNFGDLEISRENHASITYDGKGKKFYVNHGGGQNLTYLNDDPLLQPTEVKGGEIIGIGNTILKFIPLCGPEFDWDSE